MATLRVLKLVNKTEFKSAELQALKQKLAGAEESFEQLELILNKRLITEVTKVGVF